MNSRTLGTQQECRKKVRLWGITSLKKWKMILGTKVNIRKTFLFFILYLPDLEEMRYSQLYKLHISDFIFIAPKINRTLSCGLGPLGICFLALPLRLWRKPRATRLLFHRLSVPRCAVILTTLPESFAV